MLHYAAMVTACLGLARASGDKIPGFGIFGIGTHASESCDETQQDKHHQPT